MRHKLEHVLTDTGRSIVLRKGIVRSCADIQRQEICTLFTVVNRVADDLLRAKRHDECKDQSDGGSLHSSPISTSCRLYIQIISLRRPLSR